MRFGMTFRVAIILATLGGLSACGGGGTVPGDAPPGGVINSSASNVEDYARSSIWDVFGPNRTEQTVQVNRYIWAASLDVLSFLPVQEADPFTGLIITGYGNPPGGGRSYRATVHISDPALEARALKVSLQSQGGSVSPATARAVEDAILSRARQLRIADNKL